MSLSTVRLTAVLAVLILTLSCPIGFAQSDDAGIDWDNASPSQVHQKLWESKLNSILDKQFVRKLSASQAAPSGQTDFDVIFYDISLRVNDTNQFIYGVVRTIATAAVSSVSQVEIDLQADLTVDQVEGVSGSLSYSRSGDVLTIQLGQSYAMGKEFEFEITYYGHPTEGGFQSFSFDTHDGMPMISSLSEPYFARSWWPCKDRMDDKPDSLRIAVTVESSLYAASNGTLDSTVAFGPNAHTFYYRVSYPIVTYLVSVAIHPYTVWFDEWVYNDDLDTMPIVHAVYTDWDAYSRGKYNITPYVLTVLSEQFGEYPFAEEKYGHANFEWGGGMEHQTMTSMGGSTFGFSEPVVVHEAGHQWWGDMITCESWVDIWLNEGWASYAEALYYLEKDGWAAYHSYMNGMAYSDGGTIAVDDTSQVWRIFHSGLSYDKGAWVCHMLRGVLGDEAFFTGVDAYYSSEHKHGSATTEDFKNVFETATGVELDWFFDEWIYGTYRPNYRFSYFQEPSDTGGQDVYVNIRQSQTTNPQVFTMPVDLFVNLSSSPDDTVTVFVDDREDLFRFNFGSSMLSMDLDPSDWILKYTAPESWTFHIITFQEDLKTGVKSVSYIDSIESRGAAATTTSIVAGQLPPGLSIADDGEIKGTPTQAGLFEFTARFDDALASDWDQEIFTIEIRSGVPGDVDLDGQVTIADIVFMVDWMFTFGPEPDDLNTADVNGTCTVDIADLVHFVGYSFDSGPGLLPGCVQ